MTVVAVGDSCAKQMKVSTQLYYLLLSVIIENLTRLLSLWYEGSARPLWKILEQNLLCL